MSIYKELSYDQEIDVVRGIQFSVLSPDEIKRRSVVHVTKNDTYTGNTPVSEGLFDPRMGVLEHGKQCATCGQTNILCPGHFGHIELARPVYHPMFFETMRKVLRCVCYRCSALLVSTEMANYKPEECEIINKCGHIKNMQKRWEIMYKLADKIKGKKCHKCDALQPIKYERASAMSIVSTIKTTPGTAETTKYELVSAEWADSAKDTPNILNNLITQEIQPEEVLRIFKRITLPDMDHLGFNPQWNRPEWMICQVLPVPPPAVRPSIMEESGQRREDDLTSKLCDIVKFNNMLAEKIAKDAGQPEDIRRIRDVRTLLQFHIATFMNNQIPGMPAAQQRNGRKLKSIADRLKKKEGRIRGNLNGKRVDQSARSVITPDPYIGVDELGVPIRIAMNISFPEVVNSYNIAELKRLVLAGPDQWPGAKYVRQAESGLTKTLKYADRSKLAAELKDGDIVDRHMRDGDFVLFNRQPSLHKMSMMGHRVRVMPYQTFRLPVSATGPFNADFDGDEMNLFQGQSLQSMSELMDFAAVPFMIMAPKDGGTIIEIIQDAMVGSYRLTKNDVKIRDVTFANLQMVNSYFTGTMPAIIDAATAQGPHGMFTGRQALSAMLPPGFFLDMNIGKDSDTRVVIKSSIYDESSDVGNLNKSIFTTKSRGIIPMIFHDYGPFEACRFLDNTSRLVCRWLLSAGFSCGISDLVLAPEIVENVSETIESMKAKAIEFVASARSGDLQNESILNNHDFFEGKIMGILNDTKSIDSITRNGITKDGKNRMIDMIESGSKGKIVNIRQMVGCLAQQNVDQKRVAYGFTDRTLPHFSKFDDGPAARGFVENSFVSGLAPHEVFFHAMAGREGLIDTAVRSVTGDTPIIVLENGIPRRVEIGAWIDGYMDKYPTEIQHFPEMQMELLNIESKHEKRVFIPTGDEHGKTSWGELTAVTRHDPTEKMYEVKTLGGRRVVVTDTKSLLIWKADKSEFVQTRTSDVVVGDCIPVTISLQEPPIFTEYVDMTKYFPMTEYLYGSEYNLAVEMMREAQGDHFHIPRGWWEANNGIVFTVPYDGKAKLMRATARSNTENIRDGCVYPFHANREHARIPDKFELDYVNGVFVGLFLADGNTDSAAGTIQITKEESTVQEFVKSWFNKFNITHRVVTQEKTTGPIQGKSSGVVGSSSLLARFLDAFVGIGCANKFVPDVAFVAPESFVKGIVSGYLSGDGSIVRGGIEASSRSPRLIEGIIMLCSRLGIFAKQSVKEIKEDARGVQCHGPAHCLSIRAQWAQKLRDTIDLVNIPKNKALKNGEFMDIHRNFPVVNDVVKDAIVSITLLGKSPTEKVYDVTVPSTLNFSLMSGAICADTSETGYIQRRLIKAMEDCKIYYDQTVRNATGCIVQYLYAEDGMDGAKIENQNVEILTKSVVDLEDRFLIRATDENLLKLVIKDTKGATMKRLREHFDKVMDDRDYLIHIAFGGEKKSSISYPIPFRRILQNATGRAADLGYIGAPSDLTPDYILDKIDELSFRLQVRRTSQCHQNYAMECDQGTRFFNILLRMHLSPKPILFHHHFTKSMFDFVCTEVTRYFWAAVAVPGEMVGIVAAQTIGENSTQMVLDSFHSSGTVAAVKATSGVPRFKELLSVSKNIKTPILNINLKPDIASFADEADNDQARRNAMKVMRSLEVTRLCDILESTTIYYDPPSVNNNTGMPADAALMEIHRLFNEREEDDDAGVYPWVLRMKLNREKMHAPQVGLTMMDVYYRVKDSMGHTLKCVFSDDNATDLIIRVNMRSGIDTKPINDPNDAIAALKAVEFNLTNHKDMLIKGVRGIKKVSMHKEKINKYNNLMGEYEVIHEWVLDTDGTNLLDVLANPNVDETRTRSNDVWEVYNCFGIEAARNALYEEMLSVSDNALAYRHVSLLLDTMTTRGLLVSVDRHGIINNGDVGPLAKSSYEETTEKLIDASVFSQYDRINGVSANIMLGQLPPCGTGDCAILLDEDLYIELLNEKIGTMSEVRPDGPNGPDGAHAARSNDPCSMANLEMVKPAPVSAKNKVIIQKAAITFTE